MTDILAIDPGASGAFAYWDGEVIQLYKMPDTPTDVVDLLREISIQSGTRELKCYMEQVGGFAGEGHPGSRMFKFGMGYGLVQGAMIALGIGYQLVAPQKWQKSLSIAAKKGPERKRRLKERAQQLHPELKITLSTCDALLLLDYARTIEKLY